MILRFVVFIGNLTVMREQKIIGYIFPHKTVSYVTLETRQIRFTFVQNTNCLEEEITTFRT